MFENILNWKLLRGSHSFPGPDGGTCINEAAIVAAGFEYREIVGASNCPRCFSRPISAFAIRLNDAMQDRQRQKLLMPFVTRLAGSRDTPKIEKERAKLIVWLTIKNVLPMVLREREFVEYASRCARSNNFNSAAQAMLDSRYAIDAVNDILCETPMRHAVNAVVDLIDDSKVISAVDNACDLIVDCSHRMGVWHRGGECRVFKRAVLILEAALALGKQASPVETAMVAARMEAAKACGPCLVS